MRGEAAGEPGRGLCGSENADMSSESRVRIPAAGRPRVPGPRSSSLGESGPKARPTGVVEWMNGSIFPYRLSDRPTARVNKGHPIRLMGASAS